MESKIVDTLGEMGGILSGYYPPSDKRLYALQTLNIEISKVHHTLRKKELEDAQTTLLQANPGANVWHLSPWPEHSNYCSVQRIAIMMMVLVFSP